MEIQYVDRLEDFVRHRDEWNGLLAESGQDCLFLRHEWLSAWWRHQGRTGQPLVLLVRQHGKSVASAPLMLAHARIRGLPVKRIAFLGDSEWTPGDFIVVGPRAPALQVIMEGLLRLPQDIIDLRNIPDDSETASVMGRILGDLGTRFMLAPGAECPFVPVDRPWEAFLHERSAKFRKVLRNKLNRVGKAGAVSVTRHRTPAEVEEAMAAVSAIGRRGWKHPLGVAMTSTPEAWAFYHELARVTSRLGWLCVWILRLEGAPVAFEFHIRYRDTIHALVADYDQAYRHLCPGSFLDHHIMQQTFRDPGQGCTYDLGCGTQFYKANWTEQVKRHVTVRLFSDSVYCAALELLDTKLAPYLKAVRDRLDPARASSGGRRSAQ